MNSDINKWAQLHEQIKRANNENYYDHSTIDAAQEQNEVPKHAGTRETNLPNGELYSSSEIDSDLQIENLSRLDPLNYDKIRVESAKQIKVRVSTLDDEVAKKRKTNLHHQSQCVVEDILSSPLNSPIDFWFL